MEEKVNKHIDVTFTYDAPDDYLYQTNALGKTGTWTYNGPDKVWVFVYADTNLLTGQFLTEKDDGEHYPTPLDQIKIMIDCSVDPIIPTLLGADEVRDYNLLDQFEETLPDGNVYRRPKTPPPDHTYEVTKIAYNPATGTFIKPYPWKEPHSNWEIMRAWRNDALLHNDFRAPADAPESVRIAWEAYRQSLRDLPQLHGATNTLTSIDLTATGTINMAGQRIIQLETVAGIEVGDDVGMTGRPPIVDIFELTTTVVSIDAANKRVTLDKALISTPTSANKNVTFSPTPDFDAWKIHMPVAPDTSS